MNVDLALQGGAILLLVLLSAFFSSAETALTTVNRIKILTLEESGNKRASTLLKIIDHPGKMLSAILIGNNIVNLTASSLVTQLSMKLYGNLGVSIGTGLLTLVVLIFGEISPKTIATTYSEKIAMAYAGFIYLFMKLMTPFIFITNTLSHCFLRLLGIDPNPKSNSITENELRTYVDVSHQDGEIEQEEKEMIINVFDLGDTQAKDVMVPRIDMIAIDINATYSEILQIYRKEKFTRFPVYEETNDNVVGVLNVKDMLLCEPEEFSLRKYIRKPYFTYEFKSSAELMDEMRKDSINFTIVLDEYGSTVGLITLEDLLEEIVGEIRDEYDKDEENLIQQISDKEYLIEGSMKLDDVNHALNLREQDLELFSEDYDSIGGLIIEHLDQMPTLNDSIETVTGIRLTVEEMKQNHIEKVRMLLPEQEEVQDEEQKEPS